MLIKALLAATVLSAAPAAAGLDPAAETPEAAPQQTAADALPEPSGEVDSEVVERVNAYLDNLNAVQGRFVQINPDGSAYEGEIYLDRPGKARFDYDDYPLLIVADGMTVAQRDEELETTDRVSLKSTPLYYLLKSDVNLTEDARVEAAGTSENSTFVTLSDPESEFEGVLTLYFSGPSLELREWIATDALGQETRFALTDVSRAANLDPRLFTLDGDETDNRRGRR